MVVTDKDISEITLRGIVLGALITIVFTASNVYLGLKVGLTFSSSIPAAVISMAVLSLFSKTNILENNMVQTQASAAGTLSATIFVLPALLMIGYWQHFPFLQTLMICSAGGILGVIFSIPLRRTMVVNSPLPYPEGLAAAEILQVAHTKQQENETSAKEILLGSVLASIITFITSGLHLLSDKASYWFSSGKAVFQLPAGFSLALMSAGYLMGFSAGIAMLLGTFLAWFGFIPYLTITDPTATIEFNKLITLAEHLWAEKVRFIGAGTLAIASLWTLVTLFKPMLEGIKLSFKALTDKAFDSQITRTDKDLSIKSLIIILLAAILILTITFSHFVQQAPISTFYAWGLVIFAVTTIFIIGFLIAAACGYMAGLIGSSNSPISGIGVIAIILVASLLLAFADNLISTEQGKQFAVALAIFITSGIVAVASIANDNLQDLKTGFLVGATPKNQQIALLIGCVVGSIIIAPILDILYQAYGLAGAPLPRVDMDTSNILSAPQASLMKTIALGIFSHNLDWSMFISGLIVGIIIIIIDTLLVRMKATIRLPALAVGLGIYLPAYINVAIATGSILGWLIEYKIKTKQLAMEQQLLAQANRKGILMASGFIVGESLIGVFLAIIILISLSSGYSDSPFAIDGLFINILGDYLAPLRNLLSLIIFIVICWFFYKRTTSTTRLAQ